MLAPISLKQQMDRTEGQFSEFQVTATDSALESRRTLELE
jgi:hypothetical protein